MRPGRALNLDGPVAGDAPVPGEIPDRDPRLSGPPRAVALDMLRGIAILAMCLSGVIPYGTLPTWMYHAQLPPPAHSFSAEIRGLTWVDLVFPAFLFALGAAIPLALSRRIDRGESMGRILATVVRRGLLLWFFAVFVQHIRPTVLSSAPGPGAWWPALLGFLLLFPVLTRMPRSLNPRLVALARAAGWIAVALFAMLARWPDDARFDPARNDIIIVVLADVAVVGSALWLATRRRPGARLAAVAFYVAIRLSMGAPGWIHDAAARMVVPGFFQLDFLKYLLVVVPGTIAGDLLVKWLPTRPDFSAAGDPVRSRFRIAPATAWAAAIDASIVIVVLAGLQSRRVAGTTVLALALAAIADRFLRRVRGADGAVLLRLHRLGWAALALGLMLEPYEGGIRKDWATLSYLFTTAGLSALLLAALFVPIEIGGRSRGLGWIIASGENPMIAYAAIAAAVPAVLGLTGLGPWTAEVASVAGIGPWLGVARGMVITAAVAAFTALCGHMHLHWRT